MELETSTTEEKPKIRIVKPVEKWVYCKKDEFVCHENILVSRNFSIRFERPVLEISVDKSIAVRTENEVVLIRRDGEIVWKKEIKANAVSCHNDKVAVGVGRKIVIFNESGDVILKKKVGKILALDFDDEIIVVATDKAVKCLNFEKKEIWKVDLKANLVRCGFVIALANYDEFMVLTREGDILWKKKLDEIIYDIHINDFITVYTLGNKVKFDLNGNIVEVVKEDYDFKFLPFPQIYIPKKIEELKMFLKNAKELKPKNAKKLVKMAEKLFKSKNYGKSYECVTKALDELRKDQLLIRIPKKVVLEKEFTITLAYKNILYDIVDNLKVDLTDFEKYFEIEPKTVEFPPIKRGMTVRSEVKAVPNYEGVFKVEIDAKSNLDELKKEIEIKVVKRRILGFGFGRRKKKEEQSLFEFGLPE